jgi:ABC-type multidrug transport system ATPase subunit
MVDSSVTVKACNVSVRYASCAALKDVSFQCHAGEWTLLCGPSGGGKTTLLRAINGLCEPSDGVIWTLGSRIPGRSAREARTVWRQIGTLLQEVALFETKTALQNVELALRALSVDSGRPRTEATAWLERLGLGDKLHQYPCQLSGGQRQRVALARTFVTRPRLLVLDEPFSALDHDSAQNVVEALKQFAHDGATVIISTHRLDEIACLCDQRIDLSDGHICIGHANYAEREARLSSRQATVNAFAS